MYEVKNNSETSIHFKRADLGLNFDLGPGESVVVTPRQAQALELFMDDLDLTVSASGANEPDEETQNFEVDKEAAVRGVALVSAINYHSQSIRPENRDDLFGSAKNLDNMSDEEKVEEIVEESRKAKKSSMKVEKVKAKLSDDKKAKADESVKKVEKETEDSSKNEPVVGGADIGELVPMAGKAEDHK